MPSNSALLLGPRLQTTPVHNPPALPTLAIDALHSAKADPRWSRLRLLAAFSLAALVHVLILLVPIKHADRSPVPTQHSAWTIHLVAEQQEVKANAPPPESAAPEAEPPAVEQVQEAAPKVDAQPSPPDAPPAPAEQPSALQQYLRSGKLPAIAPAPAPVGDDNDGSSPIFNPELRRKFEQARARSKRVPASQQEFYSANGGEQFQRVGNKCFVGRDMMSESGRKRIWYPTSCREEGSAARAFEQLQPK